MPEPQPPETGTDDWAAPRAAWNAYRLKNDLDHGVASWSRDHAQRAFMAGWQCSADQAKTQLVTIANDRDRLADQLAELHDQLDSMYGDGGE